MNISIIIPTKNRSDLLKICLGKVVEQISKNDEVIVIDNGSSDNTKKVIKHL